MCTMLKRIAALRAKKAILSAKIQREASQPQPDCLRLQLLNRQRLRLKDNIAHATRIADYPEVIGLRMRDVRSSAGRSRPFGI